MGMKGKEMEVRTGEVEKKRFEVKVGVMFGAAVVVVMEPGLQLEVMEMFWALTLEELMAVTPLFVSLSFVSPLASAATPPEASVCDLPSKASPHPHFSFSPWSTSLLSPLALPRFPSRQCS